MTATLTWTANPESDEITKYVVFEKATDGSFAPIAEVLPAPEPQYITPELAAGPHVFAVKAENMRSQSGFSNEVRVPGEPTAPVGLGITINITINA